MLEQQEAILVVDDESNIRNEIVNGLLAKGLTVIAADSTHQAVTMLEERLKEFGEPRITVIVSDLVMPDLSGLDLLRLVRSGSFSSIPFVLISGVVTREELVNAIQMGADTVLLKPFSTEALMKKIQEAADFRMQKDIKAFT